MIQASTHSKQFAVNIVDLGLIEYKSCLARMQDFTRERVGKPCSDELWCVQHLPVFTQGVAGKPEHILNDKGIPVVQVNRGGQVTYHGPGQAVVYTLMDIGRLNIGVKSLVLEIEQAMLDVLGAYNITGERKVDAPGIYIQGAKIGSIGLRVTQGCVFHGLSFNVDMDLKPFSQINPCGYAGMSITQLSDWIQESVSVSTIQAKICAALKARLYECG